MSDSSPRCKKCKTRPRPRVQYQRFDGTTGWKYQNLCSTCQFRADVRAGLYHPQPEEPA